MHSGFLSTHMRSIRSVTTNLLEKPLLGEDIQTLCLQYKCVDKKNRIFPLSDNKLRTIISYVMLCYLLCLHDLVPVQTLPTGLFICLPINKQLLFHYIEEQWRQKGFRGYYIIQQSRHSVPAANNACFDEARSDLSLCHCCEDFKNHLLRCSNMQHHDHTVCFVFLFADTFTSF